MTGRGSNSLRKDLPVQSVEPTSIHGSDKVSEPEEGAQHTARKTWRSRGKRLGPGFTTLTSRFRVQGAAKKRPSQVLAKKSRDVFASPFPMVPGTGGLDPFLPLPTTLSERDRGLLQFYLTDLPRIWYGMTTNPVFSFARDIAVPRGAGNETHLSWMLLAAENVLRSTPEEEKTALIATRRASNYRKMRLLLEDPQSQSLDSTLSLLAVAASAELRLGSLPLAHQHIRAVLHLLRQRDGLRTLQRTTGILGFEVMHVLIQVGCPMIMEGPLVLHEAFNRIQIGLKEMHAWNVTIRSELQRDIQSTSAQNGHTVLDRTSGGTTRSGGASYWAARRQCLGRSSMIGGCLRPASRLLPEPAMRCQAASLYGLNSILQNLRHNDHAAEHFLVDLDYIVSNSYRISPRGIDEELSPEELHLSMALPATIAHCAVRRGEWRDEQSRMAPPALQSWESIEFVELVMLLSPQRRHNVLKTMHSWLTGDIYQQEEQELPDELELEAVKQEISRKWTADNVVS